jgi:hypothetical protein
MYVKQGCLDHLSYHSLYLLETIEEAGLDDLLCDEARLR